MSLLFFNALFKRPSVFLSQYDPKASFVAIIARELWWITLFPPIFLFIGSLSFGWYIGAEHPIHLPVVQLILVCLAYYILLFAGMIGLAAASRWMAPTYSCTLDLGPHMGVIVGSASPLFLGSIAHLFPHVIFNTLVFIPVLLWSMFLLYRAVPVILQTDPQRGILHASSLVGVVLVSAVSLLGLSVGLWTLGLGPNIGV